MRAISESRFGYTERQMGDAFEVALNTPGGLSGIEPFDGIYREISCRQGRPDFIALRNKENKGILTPPESSGLVGPSILSLLKPKATRTLSYILEHSEFSEKSIRQALKELINTGHIETVKTGSYKLGESYNYLKTELWAFELKLDNPKRAVFQAQQCRAYADRVIIVVPPGQETNYRRFNQTMNRWHIGLATFDPNNMEFKFIRRGRSKRGYNIQHRIYTMFQMAFG